ncbi:MAG: hypothetical protein QOK20_137, partial [Acidimicrobiaceae bacterium]|nr:hypothetical protein [Acidimicrobiaceae bacterium]
GQGGGDRDGRDGMSGSQAHKYFDRPRTTFGYSRQRTVK